MIKLVGMIAVISCCGALGVRRSSELRRRLRELRLLEQSLFDISAALEYGCSSTAEIVRMLRSGGRLSFFAELDHMDLKGSVEQSEEFVCLAVTSEEKQIVIDVFSALGTSDLETQLAMIEFNKRRLEAAAKECERECSNKCRLYNSLGFLGGIFISLLII